MQTLLVACALAAAAGSVDAGAADGPIFFGTAVRGRVSKDMATHFKASIERSLAKQGIKVLDASAAAEDSTATAAAEARAALDEAISAYNDDDWPTALADSARALKSFEEGPAFTSDDLAWGLYRDILSLRALTYLKMRKRHDADEAVRALLVVLPRWAPNREKAPPDLIRHVDDVKDELRALPPASIEVQSRPSGAKVIVDGRERGRSPLIVDGLAPGMHYVGLEGKSGRYTEKVPLSENGAAVAARLGSRKGAAARDVVRALSKPTTAPAFVEAITGVDDDALVMVLLPKGKKRATLVGARVRDGEVKTVCGVIAADNDNDRERATFVLVQGLLQRTSDGWLDEAKDEDLATLRPTLFAGTGTLVDEAETEEEPMNPAVIASAIVGAVAAVAVVGAGVGFYVTQELKKNDGFTYTVDTSKL